jgi:hypothetical protein
MNMLSLRMTAQLAAQLAVTAAHSCWPIPVAWLDRGVTCGNIR